MPLALLLPAAATLRPERRTDERLTNACPACHSPLPSRPVERCEECGLLLDPDVGRQRKAALVRAVAKRLWERYFDASVEADCAWDEGDASRARQLDAKACRLWHRWQRAAHYSRLLAQGRAR